MTLARLQYKLFAKWKVTGKESIPPKGPLIIVSNHLSNADPPVIMASINRRLNFLAKKELFSTALSSALFLRIGAYPTDTHTKDSRSLLWSLKRLASDKALLIFPEGTRSKKGSLQKAKPGVGYLALRSQAPILPVGITGTENIPGIWRVGFPFSTVNVKIGEPFTIPHIEGTPSAPLLQHVTDMIMDRVSQLLPKEYRGYYTPQFTDIDSHRPARPT